MDGCVFFNRLRLGFEGESRIEIYRNMDLWVSWGLYLGFHPVSSYFALQHETKRAIRWFLTSKNNPPHFLIRSSPVIESSNMNISKFQSPLRSKT